MRSAKILPDILMHSPSLSLFSSSLPLLSYSTLTVVGKGLLVQSNDEGQLATIQSSEISSLNDATTCLVSPSTSSFSSSASLTSSTVTIIASSVTSSVSISPTVTIVTESPGGTRKSGRKRERERERERERGRGRKKKINARLNSQYKIKIAFKIYMGTQCQI